MSSTEIWLQVKIDFMVIICIPYLVLYGVNISVILISLYKLIVFFAALFACAT